MHKNGILDFEKIEPKAGKKKSDKPFMYYNLNFLMETIWVSNYNNNYNNL